MGATKIGMSSNAYEYQVQNIDPVQIIGLKSGAAVSGFEGHHTHLLDPGPGGPFPIPPPATPSEHIPRRVPDHHQDLVFR